MQIDEPIGRDIRSRVKSIEKYLSDIKDKFDVLLRLQALTIVRSISSEREKVELLDSAGLTVAEIDKYLGKASGYASVVLYQIRKKKKTMPDETNVVPVKNSQATSKDSITPEEPNVVSQ